MSKINFRTNGNLMYFKIFKMLFPKSTIEALHATKNLIVLKIYNQSKIEQLGVCTVRLRHKDKIVRCRFFELPGESPALLGLPELELLYILKILYEIVESQQTYRKFDHQTMKPSTTPSFKANIDWERRSDNADVINMKSNLPDYCSFSTDRETK